MIDDVTDVRTFNEFDLDLKNNELALHPLAAMVFALGG